MNKTLSQSLTHSSCSENGGFFPLLNSPPALHTVFIEVKPDQNGISGISGGVRERWQGKGQREENHLGTKGDIKEMSAQTTRE